MIKKMLISAWPMLAVFLFDNLVNNPLGFYERWWWFDIPMHILGGAVAAWSLARFFERYKKTVLLKPLVFTLFVLVSGTALIGVLWEVYEFFLHVVTGFITQPSVADTVADLVNDLVGAFLWCIGMYFNHRHSVARR